MMQPNPSVRRSYCPALTLRDELLLRTVGDFGIISRPQVQLLLKWNCVSDVNRRLAKLVNARYLLRHQSGRFGEPGVYLLGCEGVSFLAHGNAALAAKLNHRRAAMRNLGARGLDHELAITGFGCLLRRSLIDNPTARFETWIACHDLVSKCNVREQAGDESLKPDAYAVYRFSTLIFRVFLETDLATEPLSRLKKKVELYRSFKASGRFSEKFGGSSFRVLIVTTSGRRALNIAAALGSVTDLKVLIAASNALLPDLFQSGHWYRAGSSEMILLHTGAELSGRKEAS